MKLSSFAVLAIAGLALAQDASSSSPSPSSPSSVAPGPSQSSNSSAPAPSSAALDGTFSNSTSLAANGTATPGAPSATGNVTLPSSTVSGSEPAIPTGAISNVSVPTTATGSCSTFLTALNTDSDLQTCLAPSLKVLESDDASIDTFCNATLTQPCSSSTIRRFLTYFAGNCSQELASADKNVVPLFDALYTVIPLSQAACAKDANGNNCVAKKSNATASAGNGATANVGQQPLGIDGLPNVDAFSSKNILFLGASPDLDEQDLCTTCTRNALTSYFAFEASYPYPSGLGSSQLLSPQSALYSAVQAKCPADFLSSALNNAGATPDQLNGAASFSPAKGLISVIVAAVAFVSL